MDLLTFSELWINEEILSEATFYPEGSGWKWGQTKYPHRTATFKDGGNSYTAVCVLNDGIAEVHFDRSDVIDMQLSGKINHFPISSGRSSASAIKIFNTILSIFDSYVGWLKLQEEPVDGIDIIGLIGKYKDGTFIDISKSRENLYKSAASKIKKWTMYKNLSEFKGNPKRIEKKQPVSKYKNLDPNKVSEVIEYRYRILIK